MGKTYPVNPLMLEAIELVGGKEYYDEKWNSMSWFAKMWYTLRGQNPGGRKGAPPLG